MSFKEKILKEAVMIAVIAVIVLIVAIPFTVERADAMTKGLAISHEDKAMTIEQMVSLNR